MHDMTTEERTSNTLSIGSNNSSARRSCRSCQLQKRKCTRELPECRLCVRGRRACIYQSKHDIENQQKHLESARDPVPRKQVLKNEFPVALFLDPVLYNCCAPQVVSQCQLQIPPKVEEILGDINSKKALVAEYFQTASRWLPIISRIRFYGSLMSASEVADPGVTSVLLAMKLALSCSEETGVCSELYTAAKEFHLRVEMVGHLSIYILQSAILIAMYEMGHAIFPGAFVTIATCARYATVLGINGTTPIQDKAWMEQEERNRAWWAIVILDRSINLGFQGRHICGPDLSSNSVLPIDEDAWDQGIFPEAQSQTLLSIPSLKNGRYARLAQAVNLLDQGFRHLLSREEALRLDLDNIAQLERTLFALVHLASFEERERNICCLSSIAICHSTILLLRTAYLSERPEILTEDGKAQSRYAIQEILSKTTDMYERYRAGWGSIERFPPLALDWLYRSAVAQVFLAHDAEPSEPNNDIEELKCALELVSKRWNAATHYLRLLETRQAVRIPLS